MHINIKMEHAYIFFILFTLIADGVFGGVLECDADTDCITEATCVDNICECDRGYTFSTNGNQCLQYSIGYRSSCQDDAQCSWLMGKHYCDSGFCECESGYRYIHGKCVQIKEHGETCTSNEECYVTNDLFAMVCSDEGICACSDGYYARGGYDCRPAVTELGGTCALDEDCKIDGAYCDVYQCVLTSSQRNANVLSSLTEENTTSNIITYAIGVSCITSNDCSDVENSICSPHTSECVCPRGYFYHDSNRCVGELGVDVGCTADSDCTITPRSCVDGACVCPVTHYHNEDFTKCIRVAYSPSFVCTDELACNIFGKNGLCVEDDDGIFSHCRCPLNTELNTDFICESTDDEEEEDTCDNYNCVVVSDCTLVNAICLGGICTCPEYYRREGNTCLPNIGGVCNNETLTCDLEYTVCEDNVCACIENYSPADETTCLEATSGLHDDCDYDVECYVLNSLCSNGECACDENFIERNLTCWLSRTYGDYCDNVEQCRIVLGENVQCRNSYCQCPAEMIRTNDGLDCITRSNAIFLQKSYILFIFSIFASFYLIR